jgi:predicted outer membrane repeat protein
LAPELRSTYPIITTTPVSTINNYIASDTGLTTLNFNNNYTLNAKIIIPANKTVLIKSTSTIRNITRGGMAGPMFEVEGNGSLTFQDIVVNGGGSTQDGTIVALTGAGAALNLESGAVLEDNHNTQNGGAITMAHNSTVTVQNGAVLQNNTSDKSGGAIYVPYSQANLANINVELGAVFTGNKAQGSAKSRKAADNALYYAHIFGNAWSAGGQGYNNWDIAYPGTGGGGGGGGGSGGGYMPGRSGGGLITWGTNTIAGTAAATAATTPAPTAATGRSVCATVCFHIQ